MTQIQKNNVKTVYIVIKGEIIMDKINKLLLICLMMGCYLGAFSIFVLEPFKHMTLLLLQIILIGITLSIHDKL